MIGNALYGCHTLVFVTDTLHSYIDILEVLDPFFGHI